MGRPVQSIPIDGGSPDPLSLLKHAVRKFWRYAAGLIAVLAVLGAVFRHVLNWGDIPTWLLAITTLLAFLAAAFAGLVAYDLLKVETARDQSAAEERSRAAADRRQLEGERATQREADRRAQASKITAWFDYYTPGLTREEERSATAVGRATRHAWGALVRNASELPVFDVRVFFYWVNDPGDGRRWTTEQRYASLDRFRVIPPGHTRQSDLPDSVRITERECNGDVYLVGIEFTDASGARWIRNERGALYDPSGSL
jgi:hypothetical protein